MTLVVIWPFDCGVVLYGIWWDGGGCMQVFVFLLGDTEALKRHYKKQNSNLHKLDSLEKFQRNSIH